MNRRERHRISNVEAKDYSLAWQIAREQSGSKITLGGCDLLPQFNFLPHLSFVSQMKIGVGQSS